jgi:hypothetical protein
MGIPEDEAKKYEGRLLKGGILVAVHCDTEEQANRAKEVLRSSGAHDIATSRETSTSTTENAA